MLTATRDLPGAWVMPGVTVAQARRALADAFRKAGLDSPELDARLLVGHTLGLNHAGIAAEAIRELDENEVHVLCDFAARRLEHEPIARILGLKEFWGRPLRINSATLVPRPETETVVEAALIAIDAGGSRDRPIRIADLGTGSGALLLALLAELPNAYGVGTDVSSEALSVARGNAVRLGLHLRTQFAVCDFGAALAGRFDLVVSNPPYIASGDIAALPPEVRYDPRDALDGGVDGLACYRVIAQQAPRLLLPTGRLVVELGVGQEALVTALLRQTGLATSPAYADLAGIPRALSACLSKATPHPDEPWAFYP
jgi:release factor glutamine methyltransferase